MARQKRLQVGSESYYLDLLLYHRGLRCLVAIDLKVGRFTHADAGQMNLYLNYLRENETLEGEAPPIGLVLCSVKDEAVAHYALGGLRLMTGIGPDRTQTLEVLGTRNLLQVLRDQLEMDGVGAATTKSGSPFNYVATYSASITRTEAKDAAMQDWCARISQQTGQQWKFRRVNQRDFEARTPKTLAEAIRQKKGGGIFE